MSSIFRSITVIFFCSCALAAHAGMNKWVDEDGVTHYGDRVPAKYLKQKRSVLNEQGVTIREVKSVEQMKADEIEKQKNLSVMKEKMIVDRKKMLRDRVLLETFTTERDILISRDARVDAINSHIQLTETIIKDHERKLEELKNRIASLEKTGKDVPENMRKELVSVSRQLETNYQYVENKTVEREGIMANFDEDIKRFRDLKAAQKAAQKN
ncbi:MAG: DUF4124 domain-containing protein [Gammaproteobacteria bacterium]|nr:DUF4124 domain-containing protein [Gammaproteobacteria bacterium]